MTRQKHHEAFARLAWAENERRGGYLSSWAFGRRVGLWLAAWVVEPSWIVTRVVMGFDTTADAASAITLLQARAVIDAADVYAADVADPEVRDA